MKLRATPRESYGVMVIDLSGRVTLGEGSALLRETLKDMLQKGHKKIVLNFADVDYIDSSGIGELVSGFTTVRSHGGELKLLNLTTRVNDILQITRLYTVFDIHSDERAAAASFR
jgi:anti-sigma B factor antagonist